MFNSIENQAIIVVLFVCLFLLVVGFLLRFSKQKETDNKTHEVKDVKDFYNQTTDKFIEVYGEVIQAFRTKNVEAYLDYTSAKIGLSGMSRVLDAGCGVAGPATHFAKLNPKLKIDAVTISDVQYKKCVENVANQNLTDQISVHELDFHFIDLHFEKDIFDAVYFLESFGHSSNKKQLIHAALTVLKPGGKIYIKDLFTRVCKTEWEQVRVNEICQDINKAYQYQIADLNELLTVLRCEGLILRCVGVPEVEQHEFEQLTISNDFQNLFNIGKIDSWEDYVFPIDFYEIIAEKPLVDVNKELHLYVLNKYNEQNT